MDIAFHWYISNIFFLGRGRMELFSFVPRRALSKRRTPTHSANLFIWYYTQRHTVLQTKWIKIISTSNLNNLEANYMATVNCNMHSRLASKLIFRWTITCSLLQLIYHLITVMFPEVVTVFFDSPWFSGVINSYNLVY